MDIKHKLSSVDWIAAILLIVGGLNWGLVGLFEFDLVKEVLGGGEVNALARIVYVLVALSAAYIALMLPKFRKD